MGDHVQKEQAKNFKKARDKAIQEAKQQPLVERPLRMSIAVTIKPVGGQQLVANEPLILLATDAEVTAIRGHERVGIVEGEAAVTARQLMAEAGSPAGVQVTILNVAEYSGMAQAQITNQ